MTDPGPATPAATIRRLRAELQRTREDRDDLRERLAYADEQIRQLRARFPGTVTPVAAPRGNESSHVTPAMEAWISDLKLESIAPAWPQSVDGPYDPDRESPPHGVLGILVAAKSLTEPSAHIRSVRITTEFQGAPYTCHMPWSDGPAVDVVVAALNRHKGIETASLADTEIDTAPPQSN